MAENVNKDIMGAIDDSEESARAEGLKGIENSIATDRAEVHLSDRMLKHLEAINKQQEELNKKTRLNKQDVEEINNLLAAHYVNEKETNKVLLGREPITVRNKKDLAKVVDMSKQLMHVHASTIKMANESIKAQSAQLKNLREQNKVESASRREEAKAQEARVKSEERVKELKKLQSHYSPKSELFKLSSEYKSAINEYKATHGGKLPNGMSDDKGKALTASGILAEGASVGVSAIGGAAARGMSGLGGALGGAVDLVSLGMKGIAGIAGAINPIAGAVVGTLGSVATTMMQTAIPAVMFHIETGIREKILNANIAKLGGFTKGVGTSSAIKVLQGQLSMSEVEGVHGAAHNTGIDLSSGNFTAADEFLELASAKKLWGDAGINTMRNLAFATGNYRQALAELNDVEVSAREGSKNLNISMEAVAQQMSQAGLQARLMGSDTYEALRMYRSISNNKVEALKGIGIDFSKEGGALVGNMAGLGKNMDLARQYYFANQYDGETNPYHAGFKMSYGDNPLLYRENAQGQGTYEIGKGGGGFYAAKAAYATINKLNKDILASNGGDTQAAFMQTLQVVQQAFGLSRKDAETLVTLNPNDQTALKKAEEAIKHPTDVLSQLQTMDSVNQNIQSTIANMIKKWNPAYDLVMDLAKYLMNVDESGPDVNSIMKNNAVADLAPSSFALTSMYETQGVITRRMKESGISDEMMIQKERDRVYNMNAIKQPSRRQLQEQYSGIVGYNASGDQYLDSAGQIHVIIDGKLTAKSLKRNM